MIPHSKWGTGMQGTEKREWGKRSCDGVVGGSTKHLCPGIYIYIYIFISLYIIFEQYIGKMEPILLLIFADLATTTTALPADLATTATALPEP